MRYVAIGFPLAERVKHRSQLAAFGDLLLYAFLITEPQCGAGNAASRKWSKTKLDGVPAVRVRHERKHVKTEFYHVEREKPRQTFVDWTERTCKSASLDATSSRRSFFFFCAHRNVVKA